VKPRALYRLRNFKEASALAGKTVPSTGEKGRAVRAEGGRGVEEEKVPRERGQTGI